MRTAVAFTIAALSFAATVTWAAEAPSITPLSAPQPVAATESRTPSHPVHAPKAAQPKATHGQQRSAPAVPGTLCACRGGDHFA